MGYLDAVAVDAAAATVTVLYCRKVTLVSRVSDFGLMTPCDRCMSLVVSVVGWLVACLLA